MHGPTKDRWKQLCELAEKEQDPKKFFEVLREITHILEDKEKRLRALYESSPEYQRKLN